jgi:hypothetical protein
MSAAENPIIITALMTVLDWLTDQNKSCFDSVIDTAEATKSFGYSEALVRGEVVAGKAPYRKILGSAGGAGTALAEIGYGFTLQERDIERFGLHKTLASSTFKTDGNLKSEKLRGWDALQCGGWFLPPTEDVSLDAPFLKSNVKSAYFANYNGQQSNLIGPAINLINFAMMSNCHSLITNGNSVSDLANGLLNNAKVSLVQENLPDIPYRQWFVPVVDMADPNAPPIALLYTIATQTDAQSTQIEKERAEIANELVSTRMKSAALRFHYAIGQADGTTAAPVDNGNWSWASAATLSKLILSTAIDATDQLLPKEWETKQLKGINGRITEIIRHYENSLNSNTNVLQAIYQKGARAWDNPADRKDFNKRYMTALRNKKKQ